MVIEWNVGPWCIAGKTSIIYASCSEYYIVGLDHQLNQHSEQAPAHRSLILRATHNTSVSGISNETCLFLQVRVPISKQGNENENWRENQEYHSFLRLWFHFFWSYPRRERCGGWRHIGRFNIANVSGVCIRHCHILCGMFGSAGGVGQILTACTGHCSVFIIHSRHDPCAVCRTPWTEVGRSGNSHCWRCFLGSWSAVHVGVLWGGHQQSVHRWDWCGNCGRCGLLRR